MRRLLLLFVALLCLWEFASARAIAEEPVGSITALKGHAIARRAGQELEVVLAMSVLRDDEIVTDAGSGVTITLTGGTRLTLSESTSLIVDESIVAADKRGKSIMHLLGGQLRSIVASIGTVSGNFEVHTPNAIAATRGTDFEVAFIEGKPCPEEPTCRRYTTVGVYQGIVDVSNPTSSDSSHSVAVTAGYQANVPCELVPKPPSPWGIEELTTPGYN